MSDSTPVIEVRDVHTRFGEQVVHRGVSFSILPGKVVALIGGSGSGKSVLVREILGLQRPTSGSTHLFGND
ncbi:MAG: ATP-binding cassette domain-containing protein, partial [Bdellovibrionales bacterium]|nr:ATP-binding cassette domain-containing protein [Bdellovibrionales bacterium]